MGKTFRNEDKAPVQGKKAAKKDDKKFRKLRKNKRNVWQTID